jgi:riboflavin kinase/FMN adenylyltransferase
VKTVQSFNLVDALAIKDKALFVAIGMFDGLHLGHRAVIKAALEAATRAGGAVIVLTFRPHPSRLFRAETPTLLMQTDSVQAALLADLGVDAVVVHPFASEFAKINAEDFLPWLKAKWPKLAGVFVGETWRFGAKRRGDIHLLTASAKHLNLEVLGIPSVIQDGLPVNSTRIRALISAGEIAAANVLLGYAYFSVGKVELGKQLGRTLGFPTLNTFYAPELKPRYGVYAVRISGKGLSLQGVANYGLRPTVEQVTDPKLESHSLEKGPCPFDYGDEITVQWVDFIRPEMKFSSLDELKLQITKDVDSAKRVFGIV